MCFLVFVEYFADVEYLSCTKKPTDSHKTKLNEDLTQFL